MNKKQGPPKRDGRPPAPAPEAPVVQPRGHRGPPIHPDHGRLPDLPEVYYDETSMSFWRPAGESYTRCRDKEIRKMLVELGFSAVTAVPGQNSQVDTAILRIQETQYVRYVGALAGYPKGRHVIDRVYPILCLSDSRLMCEGTKTPETENWSLYEYFMRMLGEEQCRYFFAWVKVARDSFRAMDFRPGQVLVVVGPPNTGKTLFSVICSWLLDGRIAKMMQFVSGGTGFNEDGAESGTWSFDDESGDDTFKARQRLAQAYKKMAAEATNRIHGKGRKAFTIPTFKRGIVTANDDPESLLTLPTIGATVADKLMIFQVLDRAMTDRTRTSAERARFLQKLKDGLETFCHWIDNQHEVAEDLHDDRYGVKTYHSPEIVGTMNEMSPEYKLLHLLEHELSQNLELIEELKAKGEVSRTAHEWETILKSRDSSVGPEARDFLRGSTSLGRYLNRLQDQLPGCVRRVGRKPGGGSMIYSVTPDKLPKKNEKKDSKETK